MEQRLNIIPTDKTIKGVSVYQLTAITDFTNKASGKVIKAGDVGGYVESFTNIDEEGTSWIDVDGYALGESRVAEGAYLAGKIRDNVFVGGLAKVDEETSAYGNAVIKGKAYVEDSVIKGNSEISGEAQVISSLVEGSALISGLATVKRSEVVGEAQVVGDAQVHGSSLGGTSHIGESAILERCDVWNDAQITGNAHVENSLVHGSAWITGKSKVINNSNVYNNAVVNGNSLVSRSIIAGDNIIAGYSKVMDSKILGRGGNAVEITDEYIKGKIVEYPTDI